MCQNRRHPGRSFFFFFLFLSTHRYILLDLPALPCLFFRISYNMGKDHVETLVLRCAGDLIERTLIPSAAAAAAPISLLPSKQRKGKKARAGARQSPCSLCEGGRVFR